MTDHSAMPDHSARPDDSGDGAVAPDYELDDYHTLQPSQIQTLLEPTRLEIAGLLSERAATISQLADALGRPKGTIGHHVNVLEDAGLIAVVRTERVRAIEAKYYGRTARTFLITDMEGVEVDPDFMLHEAMAEMQKARDAGLESVVLPMTTVRYARIPTERFDEWSVRLADLVNEFVSQPRGGDIVVGVAVALFPTTKPALESR